MKPVHVIIAGAALGAVFSVLDKRTDRLPANALIGAGAMYVLYTQLPKFIK
jgi:xanthosine utilization system XapX-like protein